MDAEAGRGARRRHRHSDRSIFGTNYLSMDADLLVGQIDELGLDDEVRAKLMTTNARRRVSPIRPTPLRRTPVARG